MEKTKTIIELGGTPLLYWWLSQGNAMHTEINMALTNLEAIGLRSMQSRLCMLGFVNDAKEFLETNFASLTERRLKYLVTERVKSCFIFLRRLLTAYRAEKRDTTFIFFRKATTVILTALRVAEQILERLPDWTEEAAREFVRPNLNTTQDLLQALIAASFQ